MSDVKKLVAVMLVLAAATAIAACGNSGDDTTATTKAEETTVSAEFAPTADAAPSYSAMAGKAELERFEGGTTVSLSVSGLKPDTAYVAHLHTGICTQTDPGGPHFQFQPGGSEVPPNEIHLRFTSDDDGDGEAKARSKRDVPVGEAGSIVLHEDESHHELTGFDPSAAGAVTTVFVHEGVDHSKEGGGHDEGGGAHGGGSTHSDKIACAELEGSADTGEGEGPTAEIDVPTITVRGGEPVGGVQEIAVDAGDQIRFQVSSDRAEEIHVHGYDLAQTVPAGGTVEFDFPAELEGIYEVELEELGVQIAELRVEP
jgi:hypothetical protein